MKKCTHCGGNNLRKTAVPFDAEGFSVRTYVDNKTVCDPLEVLICMDCAHIEWFSEKLVDALKENDSRIAQLNTELETLKAKLTAEQEKLSAIDIKIAETEEKSKSLDITIREQQSLLKIIETLKKERYGIQEEKRTAEQSIRSLQSKLNNN